MKYLSDYIEAKQSELFNKYGAFFAFSDKQFQEAKKEGIKYVSLGYGLIVPKGSEEDLINGLDQIREEGIKQDILENGKSAIIQRELGNHEAQITLDIDPTLKALDGYGITREEVEEGFKIFFKKCKKNNWF